MILGCSVGDELTNVAHYMSIILWLRTFQFSCMGPTPRPINLLPLVGPTG